MQVDNDDIIAYQSANQKAPNETSRNWWLCDMYSDTYIECSYNTGMDENRRSHVCKQAGGAEVVNGATFIFSYHPIIMYSSTLHPSSHRHGGSRSPSFMRPMGFMALLKA